MTPREQVLEVLARYCRALDDRHLDALRTLFSDDCHFGFQDGSVAESGDAAFEELARRVAEAPRHRHLVTNTAVDIEGDVAEARSDWYLIMPAEGGPWYVHSAGTYDDRLCLQGRRWVFESRTIRPAPR
jgi:3-phenylpropionate/cinnamic acid dioxygenase small subunit